MAIFTVRPTRLDHALAGQIALRTNAQIEDVAKVATWGADEHVLCALALGLWVYGRVKPSYRQASNHILVLTVAATALPHLLKRVFDQTRPDRLTALGHLHGIPLSGRRRDAFPSGHALHLGALASAASVLPRAQRTLAWSIAGTLAATRVILLAHWLSDVLAGIAIGTALERSVRKITGFNAGKNAMKENSCRTKK